MYVRDRLDAMDLLRVYSDDIENNQRIVFAAVQVNVAIELLIWKKLTLFYKQEAFAAAKLAFADWKLRARSTVLITHRGPDTLEEAVQDYINRNADFHDLPSLVSVSLFDLWKNIK